MIVFHIEVFGITDKFRLIRRFDLVYDAGGFREPLGPGFPPSMPDHLLELAKHGAYSYHYQDYEVSVWVHWYLTDEGRVLLNG